MGRQQERLETQGKPTEPQITDTQRTEAVRHLISILAVEPNPFSNQLIRRLSAVFGESDSVYIDRLHPALHPLVDTLAQFMAEHPVDAPKEQSPVQKPFYLGY
ncbi:MAG: hypothetical protein HY431_01355 [Candidatus Levybacteria bacterium]|nr:hypothetical protein [Candidatus Levybacteria bacterium]